MAPVLQVTALGLALIFRVDPLAHSQVKTTGQQGLRYPGIRAQATYALRRKKQTKKQQKN
jgi:hypothetical protein